MRLFQISLLSLGLMVAVPSLTGCGPDGTGSGRGGRGGAGATGGAGGTAMGGSGQGGNAGANGGGGGSTATGGAGGAAGVRDCFPACIANLRKSCERPSPDGGTCINAGATKCYSNGVVEVQTAVDGGGVVTFSEPDGTTPCYQVYAAISGGSVVEHYQTTAGKDVATVTSGDGGYVVTCDGTTTTVNANDPACAQLTETSCSGSGTCP